MKTGDFQHQNGNQKMTEEQKKEADSLYWWHRIPLSSNYITNGECQHGNASDFESRFGLPRDLTGSRVLDVGGWNGLFSFEAEKRGASYVKMIDIYQTPKGILKTGYECNRPFQLAKEILKSNVDFSFSSLENYNGWSENFDLILYYGVLYHVKNPIEAVEKLMTLIKPGGVILLETTISDPSLYDNDRAILEYRPGFDNDVTNQFYPNKAWIEKAFKEYGAKDVQVIYKEPNRATFRIIC